MKKQITKQLELFQGDCLDLMGVMPDSVVDLTVTSPPYDNLRTYNGYCFEFESVATELLRVTKDGGVVVWVVGDATVSGSETGTSFRQALFFKEIGFNLHDTMIYHKTDSAFPRHGHRKYPGAFEFMFVLTKGRPSSFTLIKDRKNKTAGQIMSGSVRQEDGSVKRSLASGKPVADTGARSNVWGYSTGFRKSSTDEIAFKHPAIFPEALAHDHIVSWSEPGDLVFDPFTGSGTTGKMALLNDRRFIGSEISEEYFKIAEQRTNEAFLSWLC